MAITGWPGAVQTKGLPTDPSKARAARQTNRIMTMFHTTSPFRLTRRSLVAGRKATPKAAVESVNAGDHFPDRLGQLWIEWQKLHRQAVVLCHEVQDIEARLLRTVGAPIVRVPTVDGREGAFAHSHEELDKLLAEYGQPLAAGKALHHTLSVLDGRWNAEADRIGYAEASRREGEAWAREANVACAIFSTTATSLSGVQVKLALMIQMCAAGMVDPAFPLPQLQSIFTDIEKLISVDPQRDQEGRT